MPNANSRDKGGEKQSKVDRYDNNHKTTETNEGNEAYNLLSMIENTKNEERSKKTLNTHRVMEDEIGDRATDKRKNKQKEHETSCDLRKKRRQ